MIDCVFKMANDVFLFRFSYFKEMCIMNLIYIISLNKNNINQLYEIY